MTDGRVTRQDGLLDSSVRVPDHVVYREFAKETVLLNLETGRYHGVNPTGGGMLQTLERATTVREAAKSLAARYGLSLEEMETDVCSFCSEMLERGLIAVEKHP